MLKKNLLKLSRSLIKLILPVIFKLLLKIKNNRRVINFLSEESYFSNKFYDFSNIINNFLNKSKIIALDIGAQGGFNSDNFFPKKYNSFFEVILIEPIKTESNKLEKNKYVINKGLWSSPTEKKLYILGNRLGSSSMFEPRNDFFDIHNIKKKDYENYKVTKVENIKCDTINNLLSELYIKNIDYLKIDTQGAELNILKGIGSYRPLLIKLEVHIFSMYKNVPSWNELLNYLYKLNYVAIDLKGIGSHNTRLPAEADMIFVPNFNNDEGKNMIAKSKKKFISLLLIFGQINLLKMLNKRLKLDIKDLEKIEDLYFH